MNSTTNRQTWWRKRNRLDREAYVGPFAFNVTVTTWQRQPVFTDPAIVERHRKRLMEAAQRTGFSVLAFCFMPDHLHLLAAGLESSDLAQLMKTFKQASSFDFKQRTGAPLWQRSYYDHVLRGEQELEPAIQYILDNPIRAGLVEEWKEYPFLGGEIIEEMLVAT